MRNSCRSISRYWPLAHLFPLFFYHPCPNYLPLLCWERFRTRGSKCFSFVSSSLLLLCFAVCNETVRSRCICALKMLISNLHVKNMWLEFIIVLWLSICIYCGCPILTNLTWISLHLLALILFSLCVCERESLCVRSFVCSVARPLSMSQLRCHCLRTHILECFYGSWGQWNISKRRQSALIF